jgi:hypothetical protein
MGARSHYVAGLSIGAVAALAILAGCGSSSSSTKTVTVTHSTGATRAAGTTHPRQHHEKPTTAAAEDLIRHFYRLLNSGQYERAWTFLPAAVRAEAGAFQHWKAGYRTTLSSNPQNLVVESSGAGGRTIVIGLELHAIAVDACSGDRVPLLYTGRWIMRVSDGGWDPQSIAFHQVSGGSPALSAADCPSTSTGQASTSTNCDPNYSGACLDPAAPDYDCEGRGGDGPQYVEGPITVTGDDHYGLDSDGDGVACE